MRDAIWARTVAPELLPITIDEAKLQGRVIQIGEERLWLSYIGVAADIAEQYMGRGLLTQTWKLGLSGFADMIWLPMADPLQSVTVQYYDTAGALQTLGASIYQVDTMSRPGRILRAPNQVWPAVQSDRVSPVQITYVVGWTSPALIPESIKQGIRSYVAYLAMDREGAEMFGSTALADAARTAAHNCWGDRVSVPQVAA